MAASVLTGLYAVALLALAGVVLGWEAEGDPEARPFVEVATAGLWWTGILVVSAYIASAVGLYLEAGWGRVVTYALLLVSLLMFPFGTAGAIVHMITVPKQARG